MPTLPLDPWLAWYLIVALIVAGIAVWVYMLLLDERELHRATIEVLAETEAALDEATAEIVDLEAQLAQAEGRRPMPMAEPTSTVPVERGEYRVTGAIRFGFRGAER